MELSWGKKNEVILTQKLLIETIAKTHLQINENMGIKSLLPLNKELFEPPDEPEEKLEDPKLFQAIIGGLLFISQMTRPDISTQVNLLG